MSRISLAVPITSRDGSLSKDSKLVNCYVEANPDGTMDIVKRPGLSVEFGGGFGAGTAQGSLSFFDTAWWFHNNRLRDWNGVVNYAIPSPPAAGTPIFCLDENSSNIAFVKTETKAWKLQSGPLMTLVTDVDYPANTDNGAAYLDGYYFVVDTGGRIYNSALNDPLTWTALGYLAIDNTIGFSIAIRRHLKYIVVFGENGFQFFYNAGNPGPGSPLSPVGNASFTTGCFDAGTICTVKDRLVFGSHGGSNGRSISVIEGTTHRTISTPYVEKIIKDYALYGSKSFNINTQGHEFYVCTFDSINVTLAYDFTTDHWAKWGEDGADFIGWQHQVSYFNGSDYFLTRTGGTLMSMYYTQYQDAGATITVQAVTPPIDGNSMVRKFQSALHLIGDTIATTVSVEYSDDDYTTWSAPRNIDMSVVRKVMRRLGSFYRRAFRFTHTGNTPLRLKGFELPDSTAPKGEWD